MKLELRRDSDELGCGGNVAVTSSGTPLPTVLLLTTAQAASYFGISVTTFRAHVRVSPIRIGSAIRYDRRALDEWATRQQREVGAVSTDEWLARLDQQ